MRWISVQVTPTPTYKMSTKHTLKTGDLIFHHSDKYGTASGKIVRVGVSGYSVKVEFDPTPQGTVWVRASKCQLQSDWAKENEQ